MSQNAVLGFPCMAYQSAIMAMSRRDAEEFLLTLFGGTDTQSHTATKTNLGQRAKVGYCACCAQATHIAIPPL